MKKKRVGLLFNSSLQPYIITRLLKEAEHSLHYEICQIIIIQAKRTSKRFNLFQALHRAELRRLKQQGYYEDFFKQMDVRNLNIATTSVTLNHGPHTNQYMFNQSDLLLIKKQGLDLIVNFTSGLPDSSFCTLFPLGVIRILPSMYNLDSSAPTVFHNALTQAKYIQIKAFLTEAASLKEFLIYDGQMQNGRSYISAIVKITMTLTVLTHSLIEQYITGQLKKQKIEIIYSDPNPTIGQLIQYMWLHMKHRINNLLLQLKKQRRSWSVGFCFTEDWKEFNSQYIAIENPPNHFLADPFVLKKYGKVYCFLEDYRYETNKGVISVYELKKDSYTPLGVALEEDFHLSFPFIFEEDGQLFMCPETHEAKDIRIYRCVDFPLKWKLEKIIISKINAADTMILNRGDRWYLLTNIDSGDIDEHNSELHIYSSEHFLDKPWVKHPSNPIIFDSSCSRNGGLIYDDNDVFRVFQVQGWALYGEEVGVAKMNTLEPYRYDETPIFTIKPNTVGKEVLGIHTFNYKDNVAVFDFFKVDSKSQG